MVFYGKIKKVITVVGKTTVQKKKCIYAIYRLIGVDDVCTGIITTMKNR